MVSIGSKSLHGGGGRKEEEYEGALILALILALIPRLYELINIIIIILEGSYVS